MFCTAWKAASRAGVAFGVEPVALEAPLELAGELDTPLRRRFDQEIGIAAAAREMPQELGLREQQLALEDAGVERGHQLQLDFFTAFVFEGQPAAERQLQDPLGGVEVADHRHHVRSEVDVEQAPGLVGRVGRPA